MSLEKCTSVVLSTAPYRESSLLLHLFSREHGRINGLAKGIRRGDRRGVPVERGYCIEHMAYIKPHRDLHLITDCHLREHYPGIRGDLEKTAVRDLLFDLILGAIRATDPHPELFDYLARFLRALDGSQPGGSGLLLHLSKTIFTLAGHLGFGIDFGGCGSCLKGFSEKTAARLAIEEGIIRCEECSSARQKSGRFLPGKVALFFNRPEAPSTGAAPPATEKESLAILHLACDYCRYHLDIRRRFESLSFIEQLFFAGFPGTEARPS